MIFSLPPSLMPSSRVLAKPCINAFHWGHTVGSDIKKKSFPLKAGCPGRNRTCGRRVKVVKITQSVNTTEERNGKRKV